MFRIPRHPVLPGAIYLGFISGPEKKAFWSAFCHNQIFAFQFFLLRDLYTLGYRRLWHTVHVSKKQEKILISKIKIGLTSLLLHCLCFNPSTVWRKDKTKKTSKGHTLSLPIFIAERALFIAAHEMEWVLAAVLITRPFHGLYFDTFPGSGRMIFLILLVAFNLVYLNFFINMVM